MPKLINNGNDTMAVTPPQDVARAQVFLVEQADLPEPGHKLSGQAFNVTGHPILYKWVFKYVADYYGLPTPTASIPLWFFKLCIPLLYLIRVILKKNAFVQEALSTTAMNFMGKSFKYSTEKIRKLGFEYKYSAEESIINGLMALDPEKKLIPTK
jgi:nucleoside-diphosphate-sugar epimerase